MTLVHQWIPSCTRRRNKRNCTIPSCVVLVRSIQQIWLVMILMTVMVSNRLMVSHVVQKEQFQNIFKVVCCFCFVFLLLFQFSEIQSLSNNDGNWNLCKETEDDSISFSLSIFSVCFLPRSLNVVSALNDGGWLLFLLPIYRTLESLIRHFPLFILHQWNLFVTGQSWKHPLPAVTRQWMEFSISSVLVQG